MPRRRVLTDAQLELLPALPATEPDLIRHWLLPRALATTSASAVAAALVDELRRRRLVVPGPSVVERLVAAALVLAERHVAGQLTRGLTP